jgi:hypothetical protein
MSHAKLFSSSFVAATLLTFSVFQFLSISVSTLNYQLLRYCSSLTQFLIRRWAFGVGRSVLGVRRLFEFPPLNSLSRRSPARRRINSQLSHRSSLVTGHFFSAFRLPLSAFQFFSFSVFQFFSFSPQHCHLWR